MKITLRPYQKQLITETAKAAVKHRRVLVQAPTGAGKTFCFSTIIARHLEQSDSNRVLVMTHRTELFSQSVDEIEAISGVRSTPLMAGMNLIKEHRTQPLVVAMIETLKRRNLGGLGEFSMVIVDEAHRNDFNEILQQLPRSTYLLGFTATPLSAKKTQPLKNTYRHIVSEVTVPDLISQGYLSRPVHYKAGFEQKGLRRRGGEYTSSTQMEKLSTNPVYENLVQLWRKHAGGKKTLVFNVNKEHTRQVTAQFKKHGIKSEHLLSGDIRRAEKLQAFTEGKITVLNNCDILTTGFNVPSIECVILNRATASLPLYMQMIGRASRITQTKDSFIILDFGGNIDRHGMWHVRREWKNMFYNPPEKLEQPAPMKECPNCGALSFGGVTNCTECNFKFPSPEEKEKNKVVGFLEKVGHEDILGQHVDDLSIEQLIALEESGKYKPSFVARVARTRGKDALKEYADLKDYSSGWMHYQRKMNTGYKNYKVKA